MKSKMTGGLKPINRVKVDYTVDDIMHIESLVVGSALESEDEESDDGVWIRGIGKCHALRVYLRPKFGSSPSNTTNDDNSIVGEEKPGNNSDADQGFEMPSMEKWDNLQSPPWEKDGGNKRTDVEARMKNCGPVLTFAVPHQLPSASEDSCGNKNGDKQKAHAIHECPPLLWKVDHPPNPRVAVDAMNLMEGALNLRQHPDMRAVKQPIQKEANEDGIEVEMEQQAKDDTSSASFDYDTPTNVYINGYQSWSFSGSVVQGEPQPKSAMPNVLSAAFNRGAVVLSRGSAGGGVGYETDDWEEDGRAGYQDMHHDDEDELNETTAFYKSDMFACISSNGSTSQYDEDIVLLDEEGGPALIVGFLSQRHQFGAVLLDKDLGHFNLYACHEGVVAKASLTSDWAYCQIVDASCYDEEAMVYYVHAAGDHNDARPMEKGLTCGWCSWYHYYSDIDHDSLSKNAHILEQKQKTIGFNVCLIDDGYMTAWGDWTSLKPGKFLKEGGMRVLADAIRSKGMKPGVWLAPFACDKSSQLAKDHPDWIIKNDCGRYANSANCGKFFYGLDATNPAVRKHVYNTILRAVEEWGFEVLKLDFLYASCLAGNGKYDNTMSRAEAMYLGLRTIRAAAKDAFIIGCGCPIGSAIGFVDGMRVSCDTGPTVSDGSVVSCV